MTVHKSTGLEELHLPAFPCFCCFPFPCNLIIICQPWSRSITITKLKLNENTFPSPNTGSCFTVRSNNTGEKTSRPITWKTSNLFNPIASSAFPLSQQNTYLHLFLIQLILHRKNQGYMHRPLHWVNSFTGDSTFQKKIKIGT